MSESGARISIAVPGQVVPLSDSSGLYAGRCGIWQVHDVHAAGVGPRAIISAAYRSMYDQGASSS